MTQDVLNKIDRFLGGQMDAPERTLFEQECLENQELSQLLAIGRLELEAREALVAEQLRAQVRSRLKTMRATEDNFSLWCKPAYRYAAAACLLLAMCASVFVFLKKTPAQEALLEQKTSEETPVSSLQAPDFDKKSPETSRTAEKKPSPPSKKIASDKRQLADAAFSVPYDVLNLRHNETTPGDAKLFRAKAAFLQNNFRQVVELLREPEPDYAWQSAFLLGLAYFKLGEPENALPQFNSLSNSLIYKPYGEWYAALCTIKLGQDAQSELQKIAREQGHPYQLEAAKMLDAN